MYIMVRLNGRLGGRGGTGQGEVRAAHSFAWGGRGPEPEPCQSHVAGSCESQHPFHIHFPGGRNRTSILHPFFPEGRNPTSILHPFSPGAGTPSNIHFTSIFPGKMDVKWMLDGGWKMDVGFRPP